MSCYPVQFLLESASQLPVDTDTVILQVEFQQPKAEILTCI